MASQKGFTLIELMLLLAILAISFGGLATYTARSDVDFEAINVNKNIPFKNIGQ